MPTWCPVGRTSRAIASAALVVGLLCPGNASASGGGGVQVEASVVKAAFLYNFVKFVRWPCESAPSGCGELRIGVVGADPVGEALLEAVRGKTVRGLPVRVLLFETVEDVGDVHLLFVCPDVAIDDVLGRLDGRAVLIVGEAERFAARGGAVRLFVEERRMRFEINPGAASHRGIHVSSELLALARIVGGAP